VSSAQVERLAIVGLGLLRPIAILLAAVCKCFLSTVSAETLDGIVGRGGLDVEIELVFIAGAAGGLDGLLLFRLARGDALGLVQARNGVNGGCAESADKDGIGKQRRKAEKFGLGAGYPAMPSPTQRDTARCSRRATLRRCRAIMRVGCEA